MEELIKFIVIIVFVFGSAIVKALQKGKPATGDDELMRRLETARQQQADERARAEGANPFPVSTPPVGPPAAPPRPVMPPTIRGGTVSVPRPVTRPAPVQRQSPPSQPQPVPVSVAAPPQEYKVDPRIAEGVLRDEKREIERTRRRAEFKSEAHALGTVSKRATSDPDNPIHKKVCEIGLGASSSTSRKTRLSDLSESEKMIAYAEILAPRFRNLGPYTPGRGL